MLLIGVGGGSGSGKTTVVNQIVNQLPDNQVCIISQDSYYKSTDHLSHDERTKINFDHPKAIDFKLLKNHVLDLKNGGVIEQPVYSFVTHNRTKETVKIHPKKVIIIEGILIFSNKELLNLFDIKIFVHADADERLIRRLRRDIMERGRSMDEVLNRYKDTLKPMHLKFIEPTRNYADIIIPNDGSSKVAVDIVKTVINERL